VFATALLATAAPLRVYAQETAAPHEQGATASSVEMVVVTAKRFALLGTALTASEGVVTADELQLAPAYRPGQLLETIPGLEATSHSGEGKANQYLLRGFNLDHGTDLATFVDGMPVNEPSHAHGQGYTDLNFLIPELTNGVSYTKGPYFASEGDFASVGSDHIGYADRIDGQIAAGVGSFNYERAFAAGSEVIGDGDLLGALELQHYDGPWTSPDDQRKFNGVLRYAGGDDSSGYSISAMYYRDLWNATNDQPVRAITEGLIDRYGSLDPSDGGQSQRMSFSGQYHADAGDGHIEANIYAIDSRLTLWNDFTHDLYDPLNGDQHAQQEVRFTAGGAASYSATLETFGASTEIMTGVQGRLDRIDVGLVHTKNRIPVFDPIQPDPMLESDVIDLGNVAVYGQATTHWTDWLRSVVGLREDDVSATDRGTNAGSPSASIFEPKGSLIVAPFEGFEFYVSAGRGFHTDDVRGATSGSGPLIAHSSGAEIGMRATPAPDVALTVSAFQIDFQSELTYNPDVGEVQAGPGSRRTGAELNATYAAYDWLEFYGIIASSHARYTTPFDDGTGHIGSYIPNAPIAIGSLGIYLRNLDCWSGGLEVRYLGQFPLTPDDKVTGAGYVEVNIDGSYMLENGWKAGLGLYNILDSHGDAAEFWYRDRLPAEPAAGIADLHVHPLEPPSVRFTITKML
jgi:hypothetical protein